MPTHNLEELRAAVLADPGDDAARAVLGDALTEAGDPRGELYAVQLALARANVRSAAELARAPIETDDPQFADLAELLRRQHELLRALGVGGEEIRFATSPAIYDRGGRVHAELSYNDDPVGDLARALAHEPIERLAVFNQALARIDELARVPGIARITELIVRQVAQPIDFDKLAVLLRALPKLRSLAVINQELDSSLLFSCASLHSLVACATQPHHLDDLAVSPHARTLSRLALHDPIAGADPLEALDGRFPKLTDFTLTARFDNRMRIDPTRKRVVPATLHLGIHSDPDGAAIAGLVERASFSGVRAISFPGLPRGTCDVVVAALSGKARDLISLELPSAMLARAGTSALAHFAPLERLAVSHAGPITDLVPAIRALAPRSLALGSADDAAAARVLAAALPRCRDLAIDARVPTLASPGIVRLDCAGAPDAAAIPNVVELIVPAPARDDGGDDDFERGPFV